jgi:ATP-dependent Clp protease ATP-binding subunit ClpC
MEWTLDIYLARPRRGHYEASVPWGGPLAGPVGGPSPAELREQIMFRAAELLTGEERDRPLEALLSPDELEFRRIVVHHDDSRIPTHAIVGRWAGESNWHLWLPCAGDVCLPLREASSQQVQRTVDAWARQEADPAELNRLAAEYPGQLGSVTLDLETITEDARTTDEPERMKKPETLREVADNLVHQADDDRLGRAWGRDDTVDGLVDVLTGAEAAHICLVGPPGAGKSAVVDEAVRRARSLQETYRQRRDVWRTSGDRLIAGMSRVGQWEERTRRVCRELTARGDVLVVGDLLGLIRAGRPRQGGAGVARFLEPHLHQGDFSLIIEATERTFDLARAETPGFVEALRRVPVEGMSEDDALSVVNAQARTIESNHPIQFEPDGIESVLRLARRYYRREVFPGKAVRLMRHCLNDALKRRAGGDSDQGHTHYDGATPIGADDVASVVQARTDLPMRVLLPEEGRSASAIRESFQSRVFDQPEAADVVTDLVVAIEQGMCDPRQPLGSLLLIGPSGVGKTETAKALADEAFGSEDRLIRFDMSEFAEPAAASRLIGTPASPDGELTSRVRARPYSVLLFDEIEKAHTAALDLLLQILGDGRLTDASGQTVDFTNTVVAMTSNLGAGEEDRWVGFQGGDTGRDRQERNLHYRRAAESFFRPEMFNRIGRIVPFQPLSLETLRRIARRTLRELMDRRGLRQPQIMVDVAPDLVEHLVGDAVDDRHGARTLGNRIERKLIAPLARQLTRRPDEGLTRVTIRPGTDESLSLELQSLESAPARQGPLPAGVDEPPPRPEHLQPALEAIIEAVDALAASPAFQGLEDERHSLLEAINAQTEDDSTEALDRGERLRQRELVRQSMDGLVDRARDLLDDENTLPDLSNEVRSELHRWSEEYAGLARDFTWVRAQIAALQRRSIDGGTLIVSSLSGPAHRLVHDWWRWISAWAAERGVDLTVAVDRSHQWEPMSEHAAEAQPELMGIAFSGEHPALSLLFERLAGYTFAPQPPTHGRHALALTRFDPEGTSEPGRLVERLDRGKEGLPDAPEARVEFRLDDGAFVDLRLDTTFHPPSGEGATRTFADRLACGRLASHLEALDPDLPDLAPTTEEAP